MSLQRKTKVVFFATNNVHKFHEACLVLNTFGLSAGMLRVKGVEIQSDNLEKIAKTSVLAASRKCHLPMFVEDAGLFVEALKGFPGPYAAYVYSTIGNAGLLRLMENARNRRARFESVVAFRSPRSRSVVCFKGEIAGELTLTEMGGIGNSGFGFDPVFKPDGSDKTFAEMTIAEKNVFSHRAMALRRFAEWHIASEGKEKIQQNTE